MRCPFGCREAHGREDSTRRSTAYYRTEEGRQKRKIQNGRRKRRAPERAKPEAIELSAPLVEHVRMVVGLIEQRRVIREEVVRMLARVLRQHSLIFGRRRDYIPFPDDASP